MYKESKIVRYVWWSQNKKFNKWNTENVMCIITSILKLCIGKTDDLLKY